MVLARGSRTEELMKHTIALRRVMAGAAVVGALVLGACKGSTSDEGGGGDACATFKTKAAGCNLVTAGTVNCAEMAELTSCERACITNATCAQLSGALCDGDYDVFSACFAQCEPAVPDFACADGVETVDADYACDGYPDCTDESDEANCAGQLFACADGSEAISIDWKCDAFPDCADASDEAGCPAVAMFDCASGTESVPMDVVCDLAPDCTDGSDEAAAQGCAQLVCN